MVFLSTTLRQAYVGTKGSKAEEVPTLITTPGPFIISEDTVNGKVSVENNIYKAVFQYSYLPGSHYNQGGGNIYELYDKRTDPLKSNNLVGAQNAANSTGGTCPEAPGYGGFGATKVYFKDTFTNPSGPTYYAVCDNGYGFGQQPVSHSTQTLVDNSVQFTEKTTVLASDKQLLYSIEKVWVLNPSGVIHLTYNWNFARGARIAEPSYNFSINEDYGWAKAEKYGHTWDDGDPTNNGFANPKNKIENCPIMDANGNKLPDLDLCGYHAQYFHLYANAGKSDLRVSMDNSGMGLEAGGLYQFGTGAWATPINSFTAEFSRYKDAGYGWVWRWHGWWAGNDQNDWTDEHVGQTINGIYHYRSNYRNITAKSFTDTVTITLGENFNQQILSPTVTPKVPSPTPSTGTNPTITPVLPTPTGSIILTITPTKAPSPTVTQSPPTPTVTKPPPTPTPIKCLATGSTCTTNSQCCSLKCYLGATGYKCF